MIRWLRRALRASARRPARELETQGPPDWPSGPRLSVEECRAAFDRVAPATVGVEEELLLVSAETLDLVGRGDLLDRLDPELFRGELRAAQVEIVTPICRSAAEALGSLRSSRLQLARTIDDDQRVLAAGTHPFARDWGEISDAERYRLIEDEYEWAARRSLACGVHVHVAVGGADRSLAVYNSLRSFLPEIAAIAANSPFLEGEDTGLSSVRPKLIGSLPRTGVPPAFSSWESFVGFVDWGRAGALFPDASFLWWDLRPHPAHGTIELRAADCQTDVEDTAAVAAFVHCLAVWLSGRFDASEPLPVHDSHRISENAWRALRYGVNGELVDLQTGERDATRTRIARLVDRLEPVAASIGCSDELAGVRVLLAGNGADRQRYVAAREGMSGLASWLVRETIPDEVADLAAVARA